MALKSLTDLCLDVIVKSFERFNFAFVHTEDDDLKGNFYFLRKWYADPVLENLSAVSSGKIKEDFFPLAINKYLKKFSLSLLYDWTWSIVEKIVSEIGDGLEEFSVLPLDFPFTEYIPPGGYYFERIFAPFDVSIPSHLKNLRVLSMPCICTDDAMVNIAKCCPHLVVLDVRKSPVTNEGIKHLCVKNGQVAVNEVLQKLNIALTDVDDEIIPFLLFNLPSLEVLLYLGLPKILYSMHKRDIAESTSSKIKKYKLKQLDDKYRCDLGFNYSDALKAISEICPDVERLSFRINRQEELDSCARFSKLTELYLMNEKKYYVDINKFLQQKGENITHLRLSHFSLSVLDLPNCCKSLESLELTDIDFQFFPKDSIQEFKKLKEILFCNTYLNDAASFLLSSVGFPKLESLTFIGCDVFDSENERIFLEFFSQNSLKFMSFISLDIGMPLLRSILETTATLRTLEINDCESISDHDILVLRNLASELRNKPTIEFQAVSNDEQ